MNTTANSKTLEVRRDNWSETRVVEQPLDSELADNEVLIRVDRFALTANNISYAGAGDLLGYWGFFPAQDGWGRIPAMGWGDVIASNHPDLPVGERVWGFFPFSTHLKIVAGHVTASQFQDVSRHRAEYAPFYVRFERAAASPIYDAVLEDRDSLLKGLFMTSWLVEDFLQMNDNFGGESCLITSASSKTSIALGFCIKKRGELRSIGLTSPGNVAFCESLGCYDEVVTYDDISKLDAASPVVLVDMAGSAALTGRLHHHYGDNMKHSCQVGATHYTEMGAVEGLPGATPEFFFAPGHVQSRSEEIGGSELNAMMGKDFADFRADSTRWLDIRLSEGPDGVEQAYQSVLAGSANPAQGQIVSMYKSS